MTCGGGTKDRERTCTNPAPQYLGKDCVGVPDDRTDCNTHHCPSMSLFLKCSFGGLMRLICHYSIYHCKCLISIIHYYTLSITYNTLKRLFMKYAVMLFIYTKWLKVLQQTWPTSSPCQNSCFEKHINKV